MITWITKKNEKIDRMCQTKDGISPGLNWEKVPNDWGGAPGDKLSWFDSDMRRISDKELVKFDLRKDNRGTWYNKNTQDRKLIQDLDVEPGEDWTQETPGQEPYQKWDEASESWIADAVEKEKAEKEQRIAEKQAKINDAERRIQRSIRAKLAETATEEDEQYFSQINAEILSLRNELRELIAV
jgi:hypothetical protein